MAAAKEGDTVKVHYTGKLEDGTVFDSSQGRDPMEFTLGQGQLIPGFEKAVMGLEPGQTTSTDIPSEEAYGPRRDELMMEVAKTQFPDDLTPEIGQQLQMRRGDTGQPMRVTVASIGDETVTLDANHPLAGKNLSFDIELVAIG